jgi:hypothetical protein
VEPEETLPHCMLVDMCPRHTLEAYLLPLREAHRVYPGAPKYPEVVRANATDRDQPDVLHNGGTATSHDRVEAAAYTRVYTYTYIERERGGDN